MTTEHGTKTNTQTGKKSGKKARSKNKSIKKMEMFYGQSPIIVTGGSCTMSATLHQFQDPQQNKTRRFEVIGPDGGTAGKIVSITIRDGETLYETVPISQPNDCVIEIVYQT
jgi:hypothetical protein